MGKFFSDIPDYESVSTGGSDCYTPPKIIELVRFTMGSIDLDPASSDLAQKTVQAGAYYTKEQNGLVHPWFGNIFLNPPFDWKTTTAFTNKLCDEWEYGNFNQAVFLAPVYTYSAWFQRASNVSDLLCLVSGKIQFCLAGGGKNTVPTGTVFFYFGDKEKVFAERFRTLGTICSRCE